MAREVVDTHVKPKDGTEDYLGDHLPDAWKRADVNEKGYIEAGRVPMVMREVVADPIKGFGLQMQKEHALVQGDPKAAGILPQCAGRRGMPGGGRT